MNVYEDRKRDRERERERERERKIEKEGESASNFIQILDTKRYRVQNSKIVTKF